MYVQSPFRPDNRRNEEANENRHAENAGQFYYEAESPPSKTIHMIMSMITYVYNLQCQYIYDITYNFCFCRSQ